MDTPDLETAVCRFAAGYLPPEELPHLACQLLQNDIDSPSLRILAGQPRGEVRDNRDLFEDVLAELDVQLPDESTAHWLLARRTARRLTAGVVDPIEALAVLNREYWASYCGDLRLFVDIEDEVEAALADPTPIRMESRPAVLDLFYDEAAALATRSRPRRWLRLRAESGSSPLREYTREQEARVDIDTLSLSPQLHADLRAWAADFHHHVEAGPDSSFRRSGTLTEFNDRGSDLARRLQTELGPEYQIEHHAALNPRRRPPQSWLHRLLRLAGKHD